MELIHSISLLTLNVRKVLIQLLIKNNSVFKSQVIINIRKIIKIKI